MTARRLLFCATPPPSEAIVGVNVDEYALRLQLNESNRLRLHTTEHSCIFRTASWVSWQFSSGLHWSPDHCSE